VGAYMCKLFVKCFLTLTVFIPNIKNMCRGKYLSEKEKY